MIAMQYGFTLPADYDMTRIDRRIAEKGPMLDGFPGLRFKAYLSAKKQDKGFASAENLYAPFYLWDEPAGIDRFLSGPGFGALTRDFGWPSVETWLTWHVDTSAKLAAAQIATREILSIPAYGDLGSLRDTARTEGQTRTRRGALATITAFDPRAWRLLTFSFWPAVPEITQAAQIYSVGHVSFGAR